MPTFFDPISGEDVDIEQAIVFYLVQVHIDTENPDKNTYGIHGLCTNPNRLAKDPISNKKEYWTIAKDKILKNDHKEQLFPSDKLIQEPLSIGKIKLFFNCHPDDLPHRHFNNRISTQLNQLWQDNLPRETHQGVLTVDYASPQQINELVHLSHAIFGRPLFEATDLEGYLASPIKNLFHFFQNSSLPIKLIEHGFTGDHLLTLAFDHTNMSELFSQDCLHALQEETITADDFLNTPSREMRLLLINPICLNALKSKETCIDTLQRLSVPELIDAIEKHHFPLRSPSPNH